LSTEKTNYTTLLYTTLTTLYITKTFKSEANFTLSVAATIL